MWGNFGVVIDISSFSLWISLIGGAGDKGHGREAGSRDAPVILASTPSFTSLREDNYSGPHASSLPHSSAAPGWRRHELKLFFDCVRVFVLEMKGGGWRDESFIQTRICLDYQGERPQCEGILRSEGAGVWDSWRVGGVARGREERRKERRGGKRRELLFMWGDLPASFSLTVVSSQGNHRPSHAC